MEDVHRAGGVFGILAEAAVAPTAAEEPLWEDGAYPAEPLLEDAKARRH